MKHIIQSTTIAVLCQSAHAATITFEDFTLPGVGYLNGSEKSNAAAPYQSGGASFNNLYDSGFASWEGFSISNQTDTTTAGYLNQYSVYGSGGAGASSQFAIGFYSTYNSASSTTIALSGVTSMAGAGAWFTNTTYAALVMLNGGSFGEKKFGGASGNDADWFKLTIQGYNGSNPTPTGSIDFYLADYRFSDNSQDYIVDDWTYINFAALGNVTELRMSLTSSDVGMYGMNTPAYFAMDNFTVIPEPSTALLGALAGAGFLARRRR